MQYPPRLKSPRTRLLKRILLITTGLLGAALAPHSQAMELSFVIHPVFSQQRTLDNYQPLAEYLSEATGHQLRLQTSPNFLAHWHMMKRGDYDLILDGPHFTDYRTKTMGFTVLAKMPEVVGYSLVAHEDLFVFEPADLIGKGIATLPSPAIGAIRLSELFPNPLRQPVIIETAESTSAIEAVIKGKAAAAIIPSPLVSAYPNITLVVGTEQLPAPAISASPRVPVLVQNQIREALLKAPQKPDGLAALQSLNITQFEAADNALFEGHRRLLEGIWGY